MKILFLDIDGPLIPTRALLLPNQTLKASVFDPVAVALLNSIIELANPKLVISSQWGKVYTKEKVFTALEENGISAQHIHSDWVTPRNFKSNCTRADEISKCLEEHSEVTQYVILDDENVPLKNLVHVTTDDGLLWRHYKQILKILEVP